MNLDDPVDLLVMKCYVERLKCHWWEFGKKRRLFNEYTTKIAKVIEESK